VSGLKKFYQKIKMEDQFMANTQKSGSNKAGKFIRGEFQSMRKGKKGVKSPKQAIAIGLSKARKAGVKLAKKPTKGSSTKKTGSKSLSTKSRTPKSRSSRPYQSAHA
jgi:hypothetical protein